MLNFENLQKMNLLYDNRFNIPEIESVHELPECEFIPFNFAKTDKEPEKHGVHFFLDDYQFQRVWNDPDRYAKMLSKFPVVCSPDFSMYTDMPKALQIYNHYRKHWLAAYWQMAGLTVIPTICWSTPDSYEWCFDGEPHNSIVAVSSVGCLKQRGVKAGFIDGYKHMIEALNPSKIVFYGAVPDELQSDKIIHIEPYQSKFGGKNNGR